ncbi:MAG: hypothetical protein ACK5AL_11450 [Planctomycetota bacterium]
MIENNMGLGGLEVRVRGELADGVATLAETGQKVPVAGGPARSTATWLWLDAKDFGKELADAATWLRETPLPVPGP